LFKYPAHGFGTVDFTGKGYVTLVDILKNPFVYRLPFTSSELKDILKRTAF
jgi:Ca2+-binding EF-hand superfamily protein